MFSSFLLPTYLGGVPRTFIFESTTITKKRLIAVAELVQSGVIKGVVDCVFKFSDLIDAYEYQLAGRNTGKVVVEVTPGLDD